MHAYLIIGKTESQRVTAAHQILQQQRVKQVEVITPEKTTHPVAMVRRARQVLKMKSAVVRAVVLAEAEKLTTEAANAFLKILEEPPPNTILILTAPNEQAVLPTILSRCQVVNLGTAPGQPGKEDIKTMEHFLSTGVGEKLAFVEETGDRQKALEFVISQTLAARKLLLEAAQKEGERPAYRQGRGKGKGIDKEAGLTDSQIVQLIEHLAQAKADLESNVNVKLVLADLLLNYPNKLP